MEGHRRRLRRACAARGSPDRRTPAATGSRRARGTAPQIAVRRCQRGPVAADGVQWCSNAATARHLRAGHLSQAPHHDPGDQPLPEFARRGGSARTSTATNICHWYRSTSHRLQCPRRPNRRLLRFPWLAEVTRHSTMLAQSLGGFSCRNAPAVSALPEQPVRLVELDAADSEVTIIVGAHTRPATRHPPAARYWDPTVVVLSVPPRWSTCCRRDTTVLPSTHSASTNHVGFVFAHNVFTVELLYDRLPLTSSSCTRRWPPDIRNRARDTGCPSGVRDPRGRVCVDSCSHCFYEALTTWAPSCGGGRGTTTARSITDDGVRCRSTSIVLFAAIGPVALVFLLNCSSAAAPTGVSGSAGGHAGAHPGPRGARAAASGTAAFRCCCSAASIRRSPRRPSSCRPCRRGCCD